MTTLRPAPAVEPPGTVRYLVLYGSHAHGTATPTSDEDWRGVYQAPTDDFLGIEVPERTWEQKPDITMWELAHFGRLLLGGNPNIVGLLSAPDDCVADICPVIDMLRSQRTLFTSRAMASAYCGWMEREVRDLGRIYEHVGPAPKRLSHLPRLMWELEGAIDTGVIPVRATGAHLDYIMAVKTGSIGYAAVAAKITERLPSLHERGRGLPEPPREWVNDLVVMARHGRI